MVKDSGLEPVNLQAMDLAMRSVRAPEMALEKVMV
jgi:hypothetical protein